MQLQNFIEGRWQESGARETVDVPNPATGITALRAVRAVGRAPGWDMRAA